MTCIATWIEDGNVYMAADSASSYKSSIKPRKDPKMFLRDNMLFGFTTSYRMGQILMHKLVIPKQHSAQTAFHFMCTDFIDEVKTTLKNNDWIEYDGSKVRVAPFIVGYKGAVYHIYGDMQVEIPKFNFDAIGCAEELALAALYATRNKIWSPELRLMTALETAEMFCTDVRRPFEILKLPRVE